MKTKTTPALTASLRWFKRELVRDMSARIASATSPRLRAYMSAKLANIRAMPLSALKADYIRCRASEIDLFDLARVTRNPLIRLRAEAA